ncbi:MAG: nitrite/sulfite reductase, partial [Elusimicrobia bacterium]|nr:nitrite/sulfite reductase [Elusimicrobiota bacterium]
MSNRYAPDAEEMPGDPGSAWESWARPDEVDTFDEFKAFRLQNGVYGQVQGELHMIRVKIPAGGLTADQLDAMAALTERTPRAVAHITTRQNIQFHFVDLPKVKTFLERINAVGLTTREACSNTLRTMTACHRAGVCATEAFDVSPYAAAATRYFLRNPMNQTLPRKFKVSFSGCRRDCAMPLIHDIGAVAAVRSVDGREERGFELYIGGGLGAQPKGARLLEEFTPVRDLLLTMAAVVQVFDRHGNREQKMLARMKFTVEKTGWDSFRSMALKEREKLRFAWAGKFPEIGNWVERPGDAPENAPVPLADSGSADYRRWLATCVQPQKQDGYALVHVRLPLGDVTAAQLVALSSIVRGASNGTLRTTAQQNLALRWIAREHLPDVYGLLKAADLAKPGAERLVDVTSCPGADSCQLGITSSRGMARALMSRLGERDEIADLEGVRVKISGCPNSCGQHHVAAIGLYGGAKTVGGRSTPTYQMMLSGSPFAAPFLKIPAWNVPDAVLHLVELYARERAPKEEFGAFLERYGRQRLKGEMACFTELPPYRDAPHAYRDQATPLEE